MLLNKTWKNSRLYCIYNSKIPHFYLLFVYAAHHVDHIKDICPVVSLVEKKKRSNQEIDYKITPFLRPVIFTTQSTFSLFFIFYWWEKYCNMARFSLFALGYRTYFRKLQNIFTGFYDNCKAILIINSHNPPFYHNQTKVCLKREEINHSQYSVICSRKIPGKLASRPWSNAQKWRFIMECLFFEVAKCHFRFNSRHASILKTSQFFFWH